MKLFIGADHRGFALKEKMRVWLEGLGHEVKDMGSHVLTPGDDYTDYASAVAFNVAKTPDSRGIVFCGSGVGVDVVANKVDGVRSAYGASVDEVHAARKDDDVNVLAVAADYTEEEKVKEFINMFLETEFKKEERYVRRLDKIKEVEEKN